MKNRSFLKNSIIVLLPICLGLGVLFGVNNKSIEKVEGYSTSSLPTTIDLNDTTAANIRSYYSSLNNKSQSERQGTNLLKNLKTILKNGQKYYSYDSGNAIWQIYEIADRDWVKSPASSTKYGTYDSSTKKITNYTYGTSASSSKNNPYIHALYINRNITNQTTAWDDHQQTQWGINREHVWPKAEGFEESGSGGARGDPMHLMAGNGYANNIHSNYYYGYVNTSSSYSNCGSKYSNLSGNLLGKSKTLGGSTNVFEPQDSDKGDIARAIFYMVARYNYYSGSDSDGIDSNNPNLILKQSLSDWSSTGYSSTTSKSGKMGIMTDLLAWHHADPVDSFEIHRNNLLYTNFTNNRNPFIDFPEWADYIWGTAVYSGSTYKSYSSTPTGYAKPSTDTINGYNSGGGGETVAVTGVSLDTNSTSVAVGSDVTLTPTIAPSTATNQNVTWSSNKPEIATVSGGIVTGVSEGSATITVSTVDGCFSASCSVTVTASQGGGGDTEGGEISFARSGSTDTVTEGYTLTATLAKSQADYYQDKNADEGLDLDLRKTSGLIWSSSPTTLTLAVTVGGGSTRDPLNNNVTAYFLNLSGNVINSSLTTVTTKVEDQTGTEYEVSMPQTDNVAGIRIHHTKESNYNVRIYSLSLTYAFEAAVKTLESISLDTSDVEKDFFVNEEFEYGGLAVTAHYNDGSSEPVVGYTVTPPDLSTIGTKTVTITYEEGSAEVSETYDINVTYPGSSSSSQMIVSKVDSSYYKDGAVYLTGTETEGTADCDAFTVTQIKYGGSYNISYTNDDIRVYGSHKFLFTQKNGYIITSVLLFVDSSQSASRIGQSGLTGCTKTTDSTTVTLTPSSNFTYFGFSNTYVSYIRYIIVNFEHVTLSWSSPDIDVYSGATLTQSDVNAWSVTDGTTTYTYSQLTIRLDNNEISLPYIWDVDDDGKSITAWVNNISTEESDPVCITQTLNPVYKNTPSSSKVSWTATAANNLGEKIDELNGTDSGNISTGSFAWEYTRTLVGLAQGKSDYIAFQGETWIQLGSGNSLESFELSTSNIPGKITEVSVIAATAGSHKITITVGDDTYVNAGTLLVYSGSASATNPSPTASGAKITGIGEATGKISITIAPTNSTNKALLINSVSVTYEVEGTQQIANSNAHMTAQKVAVKYAKAFNTAMESTEGCTTNMSSAWSDCSSAYTSFLSEAAALGQTEEAYAKDLIKFATAQYSDDSGEACIERMLKTYEVCVTKHGQTPFMQDLVAPSNTEVRPLLQNIYKNSRTILAVLVSLISVSAIGGYFFMKSRRKEEI